MMRNMIAGRPRKLDDTTLDVMDCWLSIMVLLLFYSSGAGVYRKPTIGWNTIYTIYFTLSAEIESLYHQRADPFNHPAQIALYQQIKVTVARDVTTE